MIRFLLYRLFKSLAGMFIDRQVAKHGPKIFEMLDREIWKGGQTHEVKESTIKYIIQAATGTLDIGERQVTQVRDLFDPVRFAKGRE